MNPLKAYFMGGIVFLIAAFCILYPLTLREPAPAEVKVKVVTYTEWEDIPGATVYLPGKTIYIYNDSLKTEEPVSFDSLYIKMEDLRGYVITYYDHFRDRFKHRYAFEVLKKTEIIEVEKTIHTATPRRLFPKYIAARYLTGVSSRTISASIGGRLYEKIMIGLAGEIQIFEKDMVGQVGLEAGYEF